MRVRPSISAGLPATRRRFAGGTRGAILIALSSALVAGCGNGFYAPVDDALRDRALHSLRGGFATPSTIENPEVWQGRHAIVCGMITAPAALRRLRSRVRFYYRDAARQGQVEFHELVAAGGVATPDQIIAHRRAFDALWRLACDEPRSGAPGVRP